MWRLISQPPRSGYSMNGNEAPSCASYYGTLRPTSPTLFILPKSPFTSSYHILRVAAHNESENPRVHEYPPDFLPPLRTRFLGLRHLLPVPRLREPNASSNLFQNLRVPPQIGLKNVEVRCPPDAPGTKALRDALLKYGLTCTCLCVPVTVDLSSDGSVDTVNRVVDTAVDFGVGLVFVSARSSHDEKLKLPRSQWIGRLKAMADYAHGKGILLTIETHPDIATNSDLFLQLLKDLEDHPAVGWNFDSANIYYYNRNLGADFGGEGAMREAERVGRRNKIFSLHLKDTDGGYESWTFPALGEGIVDFKQLIDMLEGFRDSAEGQGRQMPLVYTLELEGVKGKMIDQEEQFNVVRRSVAHLRSLGFEF